MFNNIQIVSFYTLLRNEMIRVIRIWPQSIIPPIITSALYYLIFGKLIGTRIGDMSGVQYIEFIAPGLIIMSIITNSYINVVGSLYTARFMHCLEENLVSPMYNISLLSGYVFAGVMRGLVVAACVTLVTLFFTTIHIYSITLTILVAFLSAFLMSSIGFLNGLFAKSFDDTTIVTTFILTPLIYLGGVFFTTKLLSSPWDSIAHCNPILYMVNAFRYALIGVSDVNVLYAIVVLFGLCITLFSLNLVLINKGVGIRS